MKNRKIYIALIPLYVLVCASIIAATAGGSRVVTVMVENAPVTREHCVVIDAGHGGIDGGATSCTGVLESKINLEISLRLRDLMHLVGIDTVMIRTTDESIYTSGDTIAAQKISDLKNRVKLVNETDDAILVSIHQNLFADSRYSGAQVFYSGTQHSRELAGKMQSAFVSTINPGSKRQPKAANGIYLMQHIDTTGILIECGFLSNPEEEAKLRSEAYQQKICCIIAATLSDFICS